MISWPHCRVTTYRFREGMKIITVKTLDNAKIKDYGVIVMIAETSNKLAPDTGPLGLPGRAVITPVDGAFYLGDRTMGSEYLEKAQKRFWDKVKINALAQCWEWLSVINHEGYGRMWFLGRFVQAHRLSWMFHNGEIPEGMLVCHRCDTPACVNPSHLFLGTVEQNMMDCVHKGRRTKSTAKLTPVQVEEIRAKYRGRAYGSHKLGREYSVSKTQILRILKNICWQHVEKGLDNAYGNYQAVTGSRFARSR